MAAIVIKPLAEKDIEDIYFWYSQQKENLGDYFLNQLEQCLKFIERNPLQYQVRYKDIRMSKVDVFPVCVHFTVENDKIFIHAVLNTSRDPQVWSR